MFECKAFAELTTRELYAMLALRSEVFIVEQRCVYLDPDGLDLDAHHLFGRSATEPQVIRAVVFCQYIEDGETGTEQLTAGQLAHGLTRHSPGLEFYGARSLAIVTRLARGANGVTMRHRDLDEAVRTIRGALESAT